MNSFNIITEEGKENGIEVPDSYVYLPTFQVYVPKEHKDEYMAEVDKEKSDEDFEIFLNIVAPE